MIDAFKELGYHVELIEGYVNKRKIAIRNIRKNILKGIKYEFFYSESSTMPTALTEKNHLPANPLLDFNFFLFCKKNKIPIGLFYRDIYWMYPDLYDAKVPYIKRIFSKFFYQYDLRMYKKTVSTLFLPSLRMGNQLSRYNFNIEALPPGLNGLNSSPNNGDIYIQRSGKLRILYIGGTSPLYNFSHILEAIKGTPQFILTICTRENEWNIHHKIFSPHLGENIRIVHKHGDDIKELYNTTDICLSSFKHHEYWDFAMGMKNFEYIAYGKPIIATSNTEIGDFVTKNDIGWTISDNAEEARTLFSKLLKEPESIAHKKVNVEKIQKENRWINRAKSVVRALNG
ncbi:glycosyltransferase [Compostibacter hankyongensis]|uniref:Glycosyltransferase n=2 Tax=Compostibacter hankyongensis TaxID=1007089 RepID=A0ABP8FUZ7_9BACT